MYLIGYCIPETGDSDSCQNQEIIKLLSVIARHSWCRAYGNLLYSILFNHMPVYNGEELRTTHVVIELLSNYSGMIRTLPYAP